MKRGLAVLAVLLVLAAPAAWVGVPGAKAGSTTRISATERGGSDPALYACYTVIDLAGGDANRTDGALPGNFCDGRNGDVADGKVIANTAAECDPCRVVQSFPDTPQGGPTKYLPEPAQEHPEGTEFVFQTYLKPYVVVTIRDAQTNRLVKGACVSFYDIEQDGTDAGGCDGTFIDEWRGDQDGRKNGKIVSPRLPNAGPFRIYNTTPFPKGYRAAKPVKVVTNPAEVGEFEKATIKPRPKG